ncbi:PRC-barrel domain-containing protein [Rhizobium sp.]|uniref:PRC-barrel domain-containing protein n=1 Tax=Rhizobium sp. TaxID=391 RepID=UPI0028A8190E
MFKRTISALIISAAIPAAALAQTGNTTQPAPAAPSATEQPSTSAPMTQSPTSEATTAGPFVTVPESGAWRVSDLDGKDVYGAENESIGKINDVLVSQNGSVNAVIVGVGGFLGMGEKNVAVDISALQLGPGDMGNQASAAPEVSGETTASTTTDTTATSAAATPSAETAVADTAVGSDGLPERIVLNVTKQQLEEAPEFQGVNAQQ